MKWEDTVLDYDGEEVGIILREFPSEMVSDALVDKLLQAQAKTAFKAGQEDNFEERASQWARDNGWTEPS